jgi:hypothetical protein
VPFGRSGSRDAATGCGAGGFVTTSGGRAQAARRRGGAAGNGRLWLRTRCARDGRQRLRQREAVHREPCRHGAAARRIFVADRLRELRPLVVTATNNLAWTRTKRKGFSEAPQTVAMPCGATCGRPVAGSGRLPARASPGGLAGRGPCRALTLLVTRSRVPAPATSDAVPRISCTIGPVCGHVRCCGMAGTSPVRRAALAHRVADSRDADAARHNAPAPRSGEVRKLH